jgi:hypothetical protein
MPLVGDISPAQSIYTAQDIYKPELWAMETLLVFFEKTGIRGMVHTDFNNEIASFGDTVNTRIPEIMTAAPVNAAGAVTSVRVPQARNVAVVLDQNQEVTFELRDVMSSLSFKDLQREYMEPAASGLIRAIEQNGLSVMTSAVSGFASGGAIVLEPVTGTTITPDTYKLELVAQAARELDENKVPDAERWHVVTPKQLYDMTIGSDTNTALMLDASKVGGETFLRERRLGRLFGITVEAQQDLPQEPSITATQYPDRTVDVSPFWWRNATAYVNRNLDAPPSGMGAQVTSMAFRGQSLRVSVAYQIIEKRKVVSMDVLWGWKVLRVDGGGVIKTAA